MTITKLIAELNAILQQHGDLPVVVRDPEGTHCAVPDVKVVDEAYTERRVAAIGYDE